MSDTVSYLRDEYRHQAEALKQSDSAEKTGGGGPPGGNNVEARVAALETHLEYVRRDLDEVRNDVKAIKSRQAYLAGAGFIVLGLVIWIANNRFDQLVGLIAK